MSTSDPPQPPNFPTSGLPPTPPAAAPVPSGVAPALPLGDAAWRAALDGYVQGFIRERRSERRWRVFFRLTWLLIFVLVLWSLLATRNHAATPSGPHTALLEVRGEIAASSEASAENLLPGLKGAFEEPNAKAVVLRFNSPGGSPVQAGIIGDEIRRLKALHKKKVYAVVEETCASGAYYVAVAADEIWADKASVIGSIGVVMDGFDFTGAMDKLGIRRRLIVAGANKGIADPFSPLSDAQRAQLQATVAQIHEQFIAAVKTGRGQRLKERPDTFSGLFWSGQEALDRGLVDHLGTLDQVARDVVGAEDVIDYTPKENVAERLAKRLGASMGAGAVEAMARLGVLR